jgi:hypothetical protein
MPVATNAVAAAELDQKRKNRMVMVGVAIAALLAVLFGLKAAGLLKLGAATPQPALQVRADGPTPALALPAEVKPAPLQQGAERKQMPADVEEWLKHLEKCEQEKVTISGDQMAEAMVLMQKMQALGAGMGLMDPYDQSKDGEEDKDPGSYAKGKVMDFRPRWEQLLAFFNSKVPPEECKPLAADFNRALGEVPGMMGDIGDILNSVSNDPSAALQQMQKFKGGSYGDIDRYFARADQKLSEICKKYDHNKWFNIKADVQGGSPISMFGNMGGAGALGGGATGFTPGQ